MAFKAAKPGKNSSHPAKQLRVIDERKPSMSMKPVELDLAAIGGRLKALRARLSVAQYDVAYELGVSPRTFWSWENGDTETSRSNYEMLADYYSEKLAESISVEDILFGPPPDPREAIEILRDELNHLRREIKEEIEALRADIHGRKQNAV